MVGAVLWLMSGPAQAIECAKADQVLKQLEAVRSETPAAWGVISPEVALLLTESEDGKTWTVIQVLNNGYACPVATGTFWQSVRKPKGDLL